MHHKLVRRSISGRARRNVHIMPPFEDREVHQSYYDEVIHRMAPALHP
jgi:hypothetical protein